MVNNKSFGIEKIELCNEYKSCDDLLKSYRDGYKCGCKWLKPSDKPEIAQTVVVLIHRLDDYICFPIIAKYIGDGNYYFMDEYFRKKSDDYVVCAWKELLFIREIEEILKKKEKEEK